MAEIVQEKDISFIVSHRDRLQMLNGFISSISSFYPSSQIIIAEQRDDKPFAQGQLLNLGYTYSSGKIVVFMDVDIRFRSKLNLPALVNNIDHPFLAYNRLFHCDESGKMMGMRGGSDKSNGGCCVFTRGQFEETSGYSNLVIGWGADDDILNMRVGGFVRLKNVMLHVYHPKVKMNHTYEGNLEALRTENKREKGLDGFRQTRAKLVSGRTRKNIIYLSFENIGVCSDFAYGDLVRNCVYI